MEWHQLSLCPSPSLGVPSQMTSTYLSGGGGGRDCDIVQRHSK